jgi:hypothetical protein
MSLSLSVGLARRRTEEEGRKNRREKIREEEGRRAGCVGSVESESQG